MHRASIYKWEKETDDMHKDNNSTICFRHPLKAHLF